MHLQKLIPLIAIAALATGCATTGGVKQWGAVETVSTEKALAFPPPGGPAIVSVVERKHGDDVEQTISLFTSSSVVGQNFLKVQFYGVEGPNPGVGSTPYQGISQWTISREMASAIPGVRLSRSSTFLQNTYGPFAYASGRSSSGDTCLYAWQQIHAGGAPSQPQNFSMVQVRIRVCDAHATERQLLSFVYGYTISGGFVAAPLTPFGVPQGADGVLGSTNAPIYPDVGPYRNNPMASGYEPRAARPVTVYRRVAVQPQQAPAAIVIPQQIGPLVPLPDQQNGAQQPGVVPAQTQSLTTPVITNSNGVAIPSPDCVGDAASTTACGR